MLNDIDDWKCNCKQCAASFAVQIAELMTVDTLICPRCSRTLHVEKNAVRNVVENLRNTVRITAGGMFFDSIRP